METPLLKGTGNEEDETLPSNYGSTRNERDVRTGNEEEVSTRSEQDDSFGSEENVSTESSPAASTKEVKTASPKEGTDASTLDHPAGEEDAGPAHRRSSSTKKNISQGLLNFALLTANASQLKTVLDGGNSHPYFYLVVILISVSMILQIVAGALMAYVAKLDVDKEHNHGKCNRMNNAVGILVFLVTAFNSIIPVFGP